MKKEEKRSIKNMVKLFFIQEGQLYGNSFRYFGINRLEIKKDILTIYTSVPGLLIGRGGKLLKKLQDFINIERINIKEFDPFNESYY